MKAEKILRNLGQRIRDRRKELGVSAVATAEVTGMSRVTLYRIERGEASVTMGAYLSVIEALGLTLHLSESNRRKKQNKMSTQQVPEKIRISDYTQLKRLAWQLKGTQELSPKEALELYERQWRHVDVKKMESKEKELLETLLELFGRERPLV